MKKTLWTVLVVLALVALSIPESAAKEPDLIVVQHILIAYKGSVPGKDIQRSKKEAKALALDLLARAEKGEGEFDALVKEYTDDAHPGIYKLSNIKGPVRADAMRREQMVSRFGDVAFRLEVGEVGLASYHTVTSPYGWHIIKRLE